MEKVLRAMDVIPPFDDDKGSLHRRAKAVPTLDLGEKILAEQRRLTARKRKGPGCVEADRAARGEEVVAEACQTMARDQEASVAVAWSEEALDEVTELQRIVADIVARDIERLCKGLKRNARGSA